MKKISAMAIMVVMMLPALCVSPVNFAKAENVKADVGSGGFVPVTLYFHREEAEAELDTNPPTNDTTATKDFEHEKPVTFSTDSLDKALLVDKNQSFRVAFNITVDATPYPSGPYDFVTVNLTISVLEDGTECASKKYLGKRVQGTSKGNFSLPEDFNVVEGDKNLTFKKDWDYKFDKGHKIKVKITPEINEEDGGVPDTLTYDAYMEYDHADHLGVLSNVYCAPVEIDLGTYDKNNQPKTEFMPNLAAEECIIRFGGGIEDAFGYEDITNVGLRVTGSGVDYRIDNITENKTKSLLYEWDYSKYSKSFVANEPYIANVTVTTVQGHIFYKTTSFNFSAYGLEAEIDSEASASETILAGTQADYTISIRNTGSSKESVTVRMTLTISVSPSGQHKWNISIDGKSKEVNTTDNILYPDFDLSGGSTEPLILTAKSLNITGEVGENWYCRVDIKIEFVGLDETKTLFSTTYLAPPYKINLDWTKKPDDPYYALVDVSSTLYVNVTNMGTMPDTVNLTLNHTNPEGWEVTLAPQTVNLSSFHHSGYYNSNVRLTVKPSGTGEDTAFVNITAYSKGFGHYNETLTRKYLTLNLSKAFGITMAVVPKGSENVDVKNSSGQVTYDVSIETNDNTTHTVKLTADCDNKNITTNFPKSVDVSKDSPGNVTLTVTCSQGMLAGSYIITVGASIKSAPVPEYNRTVNVTVTVKSFPDLRLVWADTNKNEITVTAKPGEYIHKTLKVKNEGNSKISVDLTPKATSSKYGLSIQFSPYSQFDLSPKEEKNITLILGVPEDAMDGETLVGEIEATSPGLNIYPAATILIEIKQSEWEKLIATLYSMIYFIILLITVIVVFIAVWVKKRRKIE
ncbi:MAG: hypothetical protein QMC80_06530 [Thermoplasmatales archaeon]|nr:hypothetical protein [Thermoplasmatales archaeon]